MPQQSHNVYCSTSSAFCEGNFAAWGAPFLEGIVRKPKRDGQHCDLVTGAQIQSHHSVAFAEQSSDVLSDRSAASPVLAWALLSAYDLS